MSKDRFLRLSLRLSDEEREIIEDNYKREGYKSLNDYVIKKAININTKDKTNVYKINSLTFSPAVDFFLNFNHDLNKNGVIKYNLSNSNYAIGEKGINLSLVANIFKVPTNSIYVAGGFTGDYIRNTLDKNNLRNFQIKSRNITKLNLKFKINEDWVEIQGNPPRLSDNEKTLILNEIKNLGLKEELIISGSFNDADFGLIKDTIKWATKRQLNITLNLNSKKTIQLISKHIYLVVLTKRDLELIIGEEIIDEEKLIVTLKYLQDFGPKNIVIILNKYESLFIDGTRTIYKASCNHSNKNNIPFVFGDAFIAAFLSNIAKGTREALKYALSTESLIQNNHIPTLSEIEENIENIKINKIKDKD